MKFFNKMGGYKAFVKCDNCGFVSAIKVTKGISVEDFVKKGSCVCDNCGVVFFPEEYTTEFFDKENTFEKKKDLKVGVRNGKTQT